MTTAGARSTGTAGGAADGLDPHSANLYSNNSTGLNYIHCINARERLVRLRR